MAQRAWFCVDGLNLALHGKMSKENLDIRLLQLFRMSKTVENNARRAWVRAQRGLKMLPLVGLAESGRILSSFQSDGRQPLQALIFRIDFNSNGLQRSYTKEWLGVVAAENDSGADNLSHEFNAGDADFQNHFGAIGTFVGPFRLRLNADGSQMLCGYETIRGFRVYEE